MRHLSKAALLGGTLGTVVVGNAHAVSFCLSDGGGHLAYRRDHTYAYNGRVIGRWSGSPGNGTATIVFNDGTSRTDMFGGGMMITGKGKKFMVRRGHKGQHCD